MENMKKVSILFFALLITLSFSLAEKLDINKMKNFKPRSIGPAGMSGRITTIDAINGNTKIIYAGAASGGLWKSESGGLLWSPIFDKEKVQSIGSIKIDQSNSDIIWVGTGEGNPRNSHNSGVGMYKSSDAGNSWKIMGLENTSNIHRIIIDKKNSNIVYAAALGSAWSDSKDRGVFKTTDAGETWQNVLFADEKTGCADLVADPSNNLKLFAAMWEFRREPWFFKSGGKSSSLQMTFDGGKNWKKLGKNEGLPEGELGRIGLAIAPSNPKVVYAVIETANDNMLYRSNNGGLNWVMVNSKSVGDRPFYYSELYAHPKNENTLFYVHTLVDRSIDGGKNFEGLVPWAVHPDHHAFWIDSDNPDYMIDGNDGGLNITLDGGSTWRFADNLPLGQMYHINVDNDKPYNVYGGMQDNGSWKGPSNSYTWGGIKNNMWQEVLFGDGFDVIPDPENSRYGYALWQGGNLNRYDAETGQLTYIRPTHSEGTELRFNWNTGIAQDPFDTKTIYLGSQFLHKSTTRGNDWEIISEDLTTNDTTKQKQMKSGGLTPDVTSAENHTTIIAIAPSKIQKGLIWVGTDDGNVQITQNDGKEWSNCAKSIYNTKNSPKEGAWVPQIQASSYSGSEVFVVMNDYRRGDKKAYLMQTKDYGKTWKNILEGEDIFGYSLSFLQDKKEPKLMFLGTENGLYVTIDAGENWSRWSEGFPAVPTMDLVYQEQEDDLVIGTFGRSAWIFDNLAPLRKLAQDTPKVFEKGLVVLDPPKANQMFWKVTPGYHFPAHGIFGGAAETNNAVLDVFINKTQQELENPNKKDTNKTIKKVVDTLAVDIYDQDNNLVRKLKMKVDSSYNRLYWDLRMRDFRGLERNKKNKTLNYEERAGENVLPGKYKLVYTYGNYKDSNFVEVDVDYRTNPNISDLKSKYMFIKEKMAINDSCVAMSDRIYEAKDLLDFLRKQNEFLPDSTMKELNKKIEAIGDSLKKIENLIFGEQGKKGITDNPTTILAERLSNANYLASSNYGVINSNQKTAFMLAEKSYNDVKIKLDSFFEKDWKKFEEDYKPFLINPFNKN